ncbi:MAG: SDR family oxidoreductase [Coriobacteriia bacterium]|nr:SDR family oxidoreductase [Coriobacteriia bacterium]
MPSILITGASSGIGEACVRRFAREGWAVTATVRPSKVDADYGWPAEVRVLPLDLEDPESIAGLAATVLGGGGVPDVLLNNAGYVVFGPIEDQPTPVIERQFRVNVFAQLELTRALLPAMRERGSGAIVFTSSLGGLMTFPFYGVYHASKHALEGFGEGLWHELKPFGIRVKLVEPGYVATPIYEAFLGDAAVEASSPAYRPWVKNIAAFTDGITARTTPDDAADLMFRIATDTSDRLRYPIASYAGFLVNLRRFMGEQFQMRLVNRDWMGYKG